MRSQEFLKIKTEADLANFLNISEGTLKYYSNPITPSKAYTTTILKKKNGEDRIVCAPVRILKYIQRQISDVLYELYKPSRCVTGYVRKKSICDNARPHTSKRMIICLDLKDFFTSIHFGRVRGMFLNQPFNFNTTISTVLANLTCRNGSLPQGAPSSPIISNYICRRFDGDFMKLCAKYKLVYTRYCDDITISTKAYSFPHSIIYFSTTWSLGDDIRELIQKHNFILNESKFRVVTNKTRQMVTGLVTNQKVNIPKNKYRKLRAELYYTLKNGLDEAAKHDGYIHNKIVDKNAFLNHLRGGVNFFKSVLAVDNPRYKWLANEFNKIVGENYFFVPSSWDELKNKAIFVLMNNKETSQGTAFYVTDIGLITCLHTVCSISGRPSKSDVETALNDYYAFLPNTEYNHIKLSYCWHSNDLDLLVLKFVDYTIRIGYEIEKNIVLSDGINHLKALGYPEYGLGCSCCFIQDMSITSNRVLCGLKLYVVDKTFYIGASGGPVFNSANKVVGYIDRGNEIGSDEERYNAFCSIAPLLDEFNKGTL